MSSIMDMRPVEYSTIWEKLKHFLGPMEYFINFDKSDSFLQEVNVHYLVNAVFWIFLLFSCGFYTFLQFFQIFLKKSKIKFFKRKQFARSIWNISFYAAATGFLYFYNELMISPQLLKNSGRLLFPTYENIIFYKSHYCDKFKPYSLFIITFYIHGAFLDIREGDISECVSKVLYSLALVAINGYRFENYFVGLNICLGIYNIITEFLFLLALQNTNRNPMIYKVFLGLKIASWSHVFISWIPFKYLVPTLFAKNFKFFLNLTIWLWYGLSIWNSPVLQYLYHQIYHNTPLDCSGEGSASKCILLKDSVEHRHYKTLKKAYLEVKLANEKLRNVLPPQTESSNATKTFKAIRAFMTLKRKVKRIREGRLDSLDDSSDDIPSSIENNKSSEESTT